MKKGKIIFVIGPSGVGKGTVINKLKEKHDKIFFPISVTTREKREGEIDGVTYSFISKEEFEANIREGKVLEYALVHEKYYYGILKEPVMKALQEGKIIVREVDYQGFLQCLEVIPNDQLCSVFLLPPSKETLIERIKLRSNMSAEELKRRMESIDEEIKVADKCDIQIPVLEDDFKRNYENFEKAVLQLAIIIEH